MIYTTVRLRNLTTGESFEFEVPDEKLREFELLKQRQMGHDGPDTRAIQRVTEDFESGLFPSHREVGLIFVKNSYTDELVAKILLDFGVLLDEAVSIVKNKRFYRNVFACFQGVSCDSGRAARVLRKVYDSAVYYKNQLRLAEELLD